MTKLRGLLAVMLLASGGAWAGCNVHTSADWMDTASFPVLPVRPADCAVVAQTPPDFNWPHRWNVRQYTLHVRGPDGKERVAATSSNWLSWPDLFPPGQYIWWVAATLKDGGSEIRSASRTFQVPASAIVFRMEPVDKLLDRASHQDHPRGLPHGEQWQALLQSLKAERHAAFAELLARVDRNGADPLPKEPSSDTTKIAEKTAQVKAIQAMWGMMNVEESRLLEAAFAAAATRDPARIDTAVRKMMNLAAWDPKGASSYASQFQVSRAISRSLAYGYDWLYEFLTPQQRTAILAAIGARTPALADSVVGEDRHIEQNSLDSVGMTNLEVVAAISALTAGDLPDAADWFRRSVPLYANLLLPWGGDDGGYANGMHYAMWEIADCWLVWDTLKNAAGLDLAGKAYARNFARTLMYFAPPGTTQGVFGDGAEQRMPHVYARYIKAYTQRVPIDEMRWLSALTLGEDPSDLALMMGPPLKPDPVTRTFDNDYWNPSTGWVAMHSDLKARDRISVYFKSSPYGSLSHSHADQNSIVIKASGQPLLIDSGYYDWYGSPHAKRWYKQTVAHNAVTFDGGHGQAIMDQGAQGAINMFSTQTDYAVVRGDATRAYGGDVRKALRTVIYLRPDRVVMFDELESDKARSWELNFHALEAMKWQSGQFTIANGAVKACAAIWPATDLEFKQHPGFDDPPSIPVQEQQWHASIRVGRPSKATRWVTVIDIGCHPSAANTAIAPAGNRVRINLADYQIMVGGGTDPIVTATGAANR